MLTITFSASDCHLLREFLSVLGKAKICAAEKPRKLQEPFHAQRAMENGCLMPTLEQQIRQP